MTLQGINSVVDIEARYLPEPSATEAFGEVLFLAADNVLDLATNFRVRRFNTLRQVAAVFATTTAAYEAVSAYFNQSPQPHGLYIGRWSESNTPSKLIGGVVALADVTALSSASVIFQGETASAIDFSGVASLAGVATLLQTSLRAATGTLLDAVDVQALEGRLVVSIPDGSEISDFATGTGAAALQLSDGNATISNGQVAEDITDAMNAIASEYPSWYYLGADHSIPDDDMLDLVAWVNGDERDHFMSLGVDGAPILVTNESVSFGSQLFRTAYDRVALTWSGDDSDYKDMSLVGLMAGIDFTGANTIIDPAFKGLPGTLPDTFIDSAIAELIRKRINYYTRIAGRNVFRQGWTLASGVWMDSRIFLDWIVDALRKRVFREIASATTRIPQSGSGLDVIVAAMEEVCEQGVTNGGIGPGQLSADRAREVREVTGVSDFDGYLPLGYLVHVDPIETLSDAERAVRQMPPVTIFLKSIGAIHSTDIRIIFQN